MGYVFKNGVLTKTEDDSEKKPAGTPSLEKPEKPKGEKSGHGKTSIQKPKTKNEEEKKS